MALAFGTSAAAGIVTFTPPRVLRTTDCLYTASDPLSFRSGVGLTSYPNRLVPAVCSSRIVVLGNS
jgi:hypothetical protein